MIWIKRHGKILAACDESIVGKKFSENKLELHLKEDFYKGELIDEKKFTKLLEEAENINLVGENTIRIANKKSLIAEVKKIKGVPYAIIFKI